MSELINRIAGPRLSAIQAKPKLAKTLLLAGLVALCGEALAGDASSWIKGRCAQTRLIGGALETGSGKTQIMAGVQIKLEDGWKTYWRNPGDSGLPPSFDWSKSRNLKAAAVKWPAPHRFSDPYGTSIGYSGQVVFPVEITPVRAAAPVELKLKLDYAICKDICVPAQAELNLTLEKGEPTSAGIGGLIWRFMGQVPRQGGQAGSGEPAIRSIDAELNGKKPRIVVEAEFPNGTEGADLFAETGEEVYLPPPQAIDKMANNRVRFTIDVPGDTDIAALKGHEVVWTLVDKQNGSETRRSLN